MSRIPNTGKMAPMNLYKITFFVCSEDCPKNILLPYLPDIMNKLESVLKAKFNELVEKGNKVNGGLYHGLTLRNFDQVFSYFPSASMTGYRCCSFFSSVLCIRIPIPKPIFLRA
jgi:hypothetical protein